MEANLAALTTEAPTETAQEAVVRRAHVRAADDLRRFRQTMIDRWGTADPTALTDAWATTLGEDREKADSMEADAVEWERLAAREDDAHRRYVGTLLTGRTDL